MADRKASGFPVLASTHAGVRLIVYDPNTNPEIDRVKRADPGLFSVTLPSDVTQVEAEAGTATGTRLWSPQRVSQAIAALAMASGGASVTVSGTAPSNPSAGDMWWDTTGNPDAGLKVRVGSAWQHVLNAGRIVDILDARTGNNRLQGSSIRDLIAAINDESGTIDAGRIAGAIARDTEITTAISNLRDGVGSAYDTLAELEGARVDGIALSFPVTGQLVATLHRSGLPDITSPNILLPTGGGEALDIPGLDAAGFASGDRLVHADASDSDELKRGTVLQLAQRFGQASNSGLGVTTLAQIELHMQNLPAATVLAGADRVGFADQSHAQNRTHYVTVANLASHLAGDNLTADTDGVLAAEAGSSGGDDGDGADGAPGWSADLTIEYRDPDAGTDPQFGIVIETGSERALEFEHLDEADHTYLRGLISGTLIRIGSHAGNLFTVDRVTHSRRHSEPHSRDVRGCRSGAVRPDGLPPSVHAGPAGRDRRPGLLDRRIAGLVSGGALVPHADHHYVHLGRRDGDRGGRYRHQ